MRHESNSSAPRPRRGLRILVLSLLPCWAVGLHACFQSHDRAATYANGNTSSTTSASDNVELCPAPMSALPPSLPAQVRVLPLGDSLTRGALNGAQDVSGGYRTPLYRSLESSFPAKSWTSMGSQSTNPGSAPDFARHAGINAETTAGLAQRIDAELTSTPHVALLLSGTNDAYQGKLTVAQSMSNLERVVGRLLEAGALQVYVAVPISVHPPTATVALRLAPLQRALREKDWGNARVLTVDMSQILAPEDYAPDGIHPGSNGVGYAKMARAWHESIVAANPHCIAF